MNEQERLQFQDMQRQLTEFMEYKRNKEIQQISYPLDEVSRTIIGNQSTSGNGAIISVGEGTTLTIAAGVITPTRSHHYVDTQGGAATDDLDTVNTTGFDVGSILILRPESSLRDVVLKDGTGNLRLAGDFTMDGIWDTITLMLSGNSWVELSRSDNS